MSKFDLFLLILSIPFILGFIHILFISIVVLITTDWKEEKRISEMYKESKKEEVRKWEK